jgi:hypothetical protein
VSSILDSILGASGGAPSGGDSASGPALPPDLMSAVAGGSSSADSGGSSDPVELLGQIIDGLHQYVQVEPDEEDKAVAMTCLTNLQKLKAKDQSEADGAMQGKVSPRMVRKAAAAQGGGPGGGY